MGTSEARIAAATMPIGMSRSTRGNCSPLDPRSREAAIAPVTPRTIGPMILSRVQIAATPMVPAPIKRASERKMVPTWSPSSTPAAAGVSAVSHGTSTPQLITRPTTMAMPTPRPTRCPTPISARLRLPDSVVPPAPTGTVRAASAATSLSWVASA